MVYSVSGASGPALSTILFAITKEYNLLGGNLIYVVMVGLSLFGVFLSGFLPTREDISATASDRNPDGDFGDRE